LASAVRKRELIVNQQIEKLYQQIGEAAFDQADGLAGKLLLYAEVGDGVVSADLFYVDGGGGVRFKFCPTSVRSLVYSLWERWREQPENREWRAMCYVLDRGKISIDLTYPDEIDEDEELSDRRPRVVKQHFGGMKVDYSKPS
jgi:hypothetical protein